MKGLDLRKLKKVSSDDKTTVFKHESGHELKVAHAGLSPRLLSELQALPMHGKAQKMAGGGYPQKMAEGEEPDPQPNASPDDSTKPQAPVVINVGGQNQQPQAPASQGVPVPAQYTPGVSPQGPQATTGVNPSAPTADNSAPEGGATDTGQQQDVSDQAPQEMSDSAGAPPPPAPQPITAGQMLTEPTSQAAAQQHLDAQTAALRKDYYEGKIAPETYNDIFEKNKDGSDRGPLGQIGILFGLLASGAGSGLAHQQNALLGMMDNEINRNLEAQKQNKANNLNALNLAESHYNNEIRGHLTEQQAGLAGQQAALAKVQTQAASLALARNQMYFAAEQEALRLTGRLPENSPAGQRARAAAGIMSNAITAKTAQNNQQAAQQIAANGQQIQQQSAGRYITTPYDDQLYKSLGTIPDTIMPASAKAEFSRQYLNAKNVEQKMPELEATFNEMKKNRTWGGNLSERINPNALAGVGAGAGAIAGEAAGIAGAPYTGGLSLPAGHAAAVGLGGLGAAAGEGLGQAAKTGLRAVGGQQQTDYETAEGHFDKLLATMLKNTPITDTARGEIAHKFKPTIMDSDAAMDYKLEQAKKAVIDAQERSAITSARPNGGQ